MRQFKVVGATIAYVIGLVGLGALTSALSSATGNDSSFWIALLGAGAVWSVLFGFVIGDLTAILVPGTGAGVLIVLAAVMLIESPPTDTLPLAVFAWLVGVIGFVFAVLAFGVALGVLARRAGDAESS